MPRSALFAACAAILALAVPDASEAIPRYAARYRQNCNLCHHNPTGGGMRSLYASKYLVPAEMALRTIRAEVLDAIQPDVTESITVGTDVRMIHHWASEDRSPPELNFFQMQGDLYVRFQAEARYSVYLDRGQSATLEIFGMAYVLPWNGYFKFGRFTPAFGWKFADHRQFVREGRTGDTLQDLFFEPPSHTDTGLEVGVYPGSFSLIAALLNGTQGVPFDLDDRLAHAVRGAYRFQVGAVGFALGGSWYRNEGRSSRRSAGGPFGYVNVGRLTWLGEADWSNQDPATDRPFALPPGASRTAFLTSHELSWQLVRGLDVRTVYNFADPDIDHQTGTRTKFGAGIDALASPFFGVKAMVNVYRNESGGGAAITDVSELDYVQTELTLHVFY